MASRQTLLRPDGLPRLNPKKTTLISPAQAVQTIFHEFAEDSASVYDEHTRRMVNLAFRFGYRCALVDCVPHPELVTMEKVKERAMHWLEEKYHIFSDADAKPPIIVP